MWDGQCIGRDWRVYQSLRVIRLDTYQMLQKWNGNSAFIKKMCMYMYMYMYYQGKLPFNSNPCNNTIQPGWRPWSATVISTDWQPYTDNRNKISFQINLVQYNYDTCMKSSLYGANHLGETIERLISFWKD